MNVTGRNTWPGSVQRGHPGNHCHPEPRWLVLCLSNLKTRQPGSHEFMSETPDSKETTHFGYQTVDVEEKAERVRGVFDSVANSYDIMNDLMSFGIHRLWKHIAVDLAGVRSGMKVLDLASGTGDLASRFAGLVGPEGEVVTAPSEPEDPPHGGDIRTVRASGMAAMARLPRGVRRVWSGWDGHRLSFARGALSAAMTRQLSDVFEGDFFDF